MPSASANTVAFAERRVLRQSCPSPDALAASSCPSPPLRAAPVARKTDRTTHQSQRPLGDVALDDGLVRFRTALDEHGAVRRLVPPPADASRLPPHSAADARAAESFTWWALTAHAHEKSESTSPPSESRSTLLKNMHPERPPTSRRRPRPPRSSSRSTSRDTRSGPGPSRPRPRPVLKYQWPRRRRRRRRPRLLIVRTRRNPTDRGQKLRRGPRRLLPQAKEAHQGGHVVAGIF